MRTNPWGIPEALLGDRNRKVPAVSPLQICEVHDVLAYGRCYMVKAPGLPRMPAMLGSLSSSMLPIGARDISMIAPGTMVLCWISDQFYAVILSVMTTPMGSSQLGWPDSIVSAGHAGLYSDPAHQILATKDSSHGFLDFSSGAPIDSLPGDWGHCTELGLAVFLGRLMASIRAGELCKLEFHYIDQLARLYAYNWQHYTAGSEDEAFDDEGEWSRVRGFGLYPWEAAGVSAKGGVAFKNNGNVNPLDQQLDGPPNELAIEPTDPKQTSFVRYKEIEGFLGHLRRRFVLLPNTNVPVRMFGRTAADAATYRGVFDEVLAADGSYLMRSAKSIGFQKTIWIPVPDELYPRDNPNGDKDFEPGQDMDFTEFPQQASAGELVARQRDRMEHDVNKRFSEPLNQHDKDWAFRDEQGKIQTPGRFTTEQVPLSSYDTFEQALPADAVATEPLSGVGTGNSARYYKTEAFFGFLEDGSFLIRDAYGSEIRMTGGNIEISCPGDVINRTGRTVQMIGGKDVIIKAHQNLECSTAQGSVRVKAENNLTMLGGNNGTGGVLIESRGAEKNNFDQKGDDSVVGGLVLKNAAGYVNLIGKELYLWSDSNMTFDSNGMDGGITVYASKVEQFLKTSAKTVIAPNKQATGDPKNRSTMIHTLSGFGFFGGDMDCGVGSLSVYNPRSDSLGSSLRVNGAGTFNGGVGSNSKNTTEMDVASDRQQFVSRNNQSSSTVNTAYSDLSAKYRTDVVDTTGLGNLQTLTKVGFSFRLSTQLTLGNMVIYECEWQKRLRQSAGITADGKYGEVWDEPEVAANLDENGAPDQGYLTKPFPGLEAWDNGTGAMYAQIDDQFYDPANGGTPKPRGTKGENYKEIDLPKVNGGVETPDGKAFKGRYPVNKQ